TTKIGMFGVELLERAHDTRPATIRTGLVVVPDQKATLAKKSKSSPRVVEHVLVRVRTIDKDKVHFSFVGPEVELGRISQKLGNPLRMVRPLKAHARRGLLNIFAIV